MLTLAVSGSVVRRFKVSKEIMKNSRKSFQIDVQKNWNLRTDGSETIVFVDDGEVVFKFTGKPNEIFDVKEVETSYGSIHFCLETKSSRELFFRKRLHFSSPHDFDDFLTKFDFAKVSLLQVVDS